MTRPVYGVLRSETHGYVRQMGRSQLLVALVLRLLQAASLVLAPEREMHFVVRLFDGREPLPGAG